MTPDLLLLLDVTAIGTTLLAAFFWWRASGVKVRRISKQEDVTSADLNRIIVSINRSQMLNMRAAIASAFSALIIAMRFAAALLPA